MSVIIYHFLFYFDVSCVRVCARGGGVMSNDYKMICVAHKIKKMCSIQVTPRIDL